MNQRKCYPVNISAPNLLSICVDGMENDEIQGRIYHYYGEEPVRFESVLQMVRIMDRIYDTLVFPQSSTESRSFSKKRVVAAGAGNRGTKKEKQVSADSLLSQTGEIGTFVTNVKFRQCTTWQGEFFWKEKESKIFFNSTMEFVRRLDQALVSL